MDSESQELRDRVQHNLVGFLGNELDLGFAFSETAKIESAMRNQEHFEISREHAREALRSFDYYKNRIVNAEIRRELQERAHELEKVIASL